MRFDRVIVVDWSASSVPKTGKDSIWVGEAGLPPVNLPTRAAAVGHLHRRISDALAAGERLLIGADFPFGFPTGFAAGLTGQPRALAVWDWLAARLQDDDRNRNTRFAVAAAINRHFPGVGPFWGRPAHHDHPDLPDKGSLRRDHGLPERRRCEALVPGTQPGWKLFTTGSVGSQALTGIPALHRLRALVPGQVAVWPFEAWDGAPVVVAEIFPSMLAPQVRAATGYPCKDAAQVDLLARALANADLGPMLVPDIAAETLIEEGWILGAGHAPALAMALSARARTGRPATG